MHRSVANGDEVPPADGGHGAGRPHQGHDGHHHQQVVDAPGEARPHDLSQVAPLTWLDSPGTPESADRTLCSTEVEKMDPSAAMATASPTWRKVELTPDAMPTRLGATTPTAVEASGGLTSSAPTPETRSPGSRWVHELAAVTPVMSNRPIPTSASPGPMSQRVGTRSLSRPLGAVATKRAPVEASSRRPVSSGE